MGPQAFTELDLLPQQLSNEDINSNNGIRLRVYTFISLGLHIR